MSNLKTVISFELAVLLYGMCLEIRPARIADLGSGFSSYVLRRYVVEEDDSATVTSVDDDPEWLDKTRAYLEQNRLPADGLFTWAEFSSDKTRHERFDLVLHDLGSMGTRLASLPRVTEVVSPDGLLLLDDFHKRAYREAAAKMLRGNGFKVFSLRLWTLDSFGRFGALAVPPSTG